MWGGGNNEDPFKDIETFFRRLSSSALLGGGEGSFRLRLPGLGANGGSFETSSRGNFTPGVTVEDHQTHYTIEADVAGIPRDDLKVQVMPENKGGRVCISGMRRATAAWELARQQKGNGPSSGSGASTWLDERPSGSFERCFTFPERLDENGVSATHINGVLSVQVPHERAADNDSDRTRTVNIR